MPRSIPLRFMTILFITQFRHSIAILNPTLELPKSSSRSTCFSLTTYFRTFLFSFRILETQIFGKGMRGERAHLSYTHRHFLCLVVGGNGSRGKLGFADKFNGWDTAPPLLPSSLFDSTPRNINGSKGRCGNGRLQMYS